MPKIDLEANSGIEPERCVEQSTHMRLVLSVQDCGSGVVLENFFCLGGFPDLHGASSAVIPLLLRLRDGCGLLDLFGDFLSATSR
jgi:hypothetical protein